MLQYITNDRSVLSPSGQILAVIDGGCRWVQIRMKDATDDEIKNVFEEIKDKARETGTTVIIDDRVHLVKQLGEQGVAGVHLGKTDMSPVQARALLGPNAIIGVTANTFEDIEAVKQIDIDYIGVGPYADTDTKKNLAPVLGLEGIAEIMLRVKADAIELPCVAIGGIGLEDVKPLIEVGVNGIAVSGSIAFAENLTKATKEFLSLLPMNE